MELNRKWRVLFGIFFIGSLLVTCKSKQPIPNGTSEENGQLTEAISMGDNLNGYTEKIPLTEITFDMVGIPSGSFMMGSPDTEPNRNPDEG